MTDWKLFRGNCNNEPKALTTIPEPPPWRKFKPIDQVDQKTDNEYWKQLLAKQNQRAIARGRSFKIQTDKNGYSEIVDAVNAAINLRRPLMVTGVPGMGKTSLPYAIAYELQLGPVLVWPITARSTVQDALYRYDAIARLQDAQLDKMRSPGLSEGDPPPTEEGRLGDYITLGSLGTAFLPSRRPRVLLIDEIDKSDLNLPNDLLNLFEEGSFKIGELMRRKRRTGDRDGQDSIENSTETVRTADDLEVDITNGWVECCEFPIVIMTSNGEREFPPAFYRRCLRVEMPKPTPESLLSIVQSHFNVNGNDWTATEEQLDELIEEFLGRDRKADRATDQLLNAVYLMTRKGSPGEDDMEKLKKLLFKRLSQGS